MQNKKLVWAIVVLLIGSAALLETKTGLLSLGSVWLIDSEKRLNILYVLGQTILVFAAIYFGLWNKRLHKTAEEQSQNAQQQLTLLHDQMLLMRKQHMRSIAPKITVSGIGEVQNIHFSHDNDPMGFDRKFVRIDIKNFDLQNAALNIFAIFSCGDKEYMSMGRDASLASSDSSFIDAYYEPVKPAIPFLSSHYGKVAAEAVKSLFSDYHADIYGIAVVACRDFEMNTHISCRIFRMDSEGQEEDRLDEFHYSFLYEDAVLGEKEISLGAAVVSSGSRSSGSRSRA